MLVFAMMRTRQAGLPFLLARLPDLPSHHPTSPNLSFSFPSHLTCVALFTIGSLSEYEMMELGGLEGLKALQQ